MQSVKIKQLNEIITNFIETIRAATQRLISQLDDIHLTINNLLEMWLQFTQDILQDADQISAAQITYWQDYLVLCEDLHQQLTLNQPTSMQIDQSWRDPILLAFAEKYYALICREARKLLKNIFDFQDGDARQQLETFYRKFAEAFSLANFKNDTLLVESPIEVSK